MAASLISNMIWLHGSSGGGGHLWRRICWVSQQVATTKMIKYIKPPWNVELIKLRLQFRERLLLNICQPLLSKLSPVKFQISQPLAKILQQDDAAVWWAIGWVTRKPTPLLHNCMAECNSVTLNSRNGFLCDLYRLVNRSSLCLCKISRCPCPMSSWMRMFWEWIGGTINQNP